MAQFHSRSIIVSKGFSRHLMERAGLLQYTAEVGKTTLVIEYDADSGDGRLDVICEDTIPTNPTGTGSYT